jgi:SnoaL-like domain
MTTLEVATRLVEIIKTGDAHQAFAELYHPEIVTIEASPENREMTGIEACKQKGEWFNSMFEVHGSEILGPFPNEDEFALLITYHLTHRESGNKFPMTEVAIYTVADSKIVREKFYYSMEGMGA